MAAKDYFMKFFLTKSILVLRVLIDLCLKVDDMRIGESALKCFFEGVHIFLQGHPTSTFYSHSLFCFQKKTAIIDDGGLRERERE